MNNNLLGDIRETLGLIIQVSPEEINEKTGRGHTENWDSLAHLNLVLALMEKYGIEFLPEEMEQMITVGDVVEMVQSKLDRQ